MEPQPTSNPYDRPPITDEQKRAAEAKRKEMILEISKQVYKTGEDEEQAVYHKHNNVYYPHEVQALPDEQKQALAETIVAWRNAPENSGFLEPLSLDQLLECINHNEIFVFMVDDALLACARLYPDLEHQRNGKGRVIFGMDMKRPISFTTTENPEAPSAFKHVAQARLAFCAALYPTLRPRTGIDATNKRNIEFHLNTLGLDQVTPEEPSMAESRIIVKLNKLVQPLIGIKLPDEVMSAYTGNSTSETVPSQDK